MKQRGGSVADGDDSAFQTWPPQFDGGGGAGIADGFRTGGDRRVIQRDDHVVPGGQVAADDPGAYHFAVAKHRCPSAQGCGPGVEGVLGEGEAVGHLDHPASVDEPDGETVHPLGETVQTRLAADRREASGVDRRGFPLVSQWGFRRAAHVDRADSGPCGCFAWGYAAW